MKGGAVGCAKRTHCGVGVLRCGRWWCCDGGACVDCEWRPSSAFRCGGMLGRFRPACSALRALPEHQGNVLCKLWWMPAPLPQAAPVGGASTPLPPFSRGSKGAPDGVEMGVCSALVSTSAALRCLPHTRCAKPRPSAGGLSVCGFPFLACGWLLAVG